MKITKAKFYNKVIENLCKKYFDYQLEVLVEDENRTTIALVNNRVHSVEYILEYRQDLNSFVNIVGIFARPSTSFMWYLENIEKELANDEYKSRV